MQEQKAMTAPLEGVRVLDFSIMLAGPYCARLLADVGADVIKIEPPEGDDMRLRTPLRDGHSTYFGQLNAGKKSIALDLKSPEAIRLVHRMIESTDIVVENFRPGVMDRLGLSYEALREINPRLIYCSISGYGQSGPAAERAAYAMIVHAESGLDRSLMRYAGDRDRPAAGAIFVADVLGGIFGFSAIQTALVQRGRTGEGQRIDVALMDCMLNLLVYELQEAQFPIRSSRPTYGPVRTLDGDILIAPITPHIAHHLWRELEFGEDVMRAPWPEPDAAALEQDEIELVVQVNGKLRGSIRVPKAAGRSEIEELARANPNVQRFVAGQNVKKVVVVPGRLVNLVV